MPVDYDFLIALLHRHFANRHRELAYALQRREWAYRLVQKLPPHERTDPDEWFHHLAKLVQLEGRETALLHDLHELRKELRVPQDSSELVDLLQALFDQGELSRALQLEAWADGLVQHLSPVEHMTPAAWFHGVVRLVVQRDEMPELLAMVRRLRPKWSADIDAVERSLKSEAGATVAGVPAAWLGLTRSR